MRRVIVFLGLSFLYLMSYAQIIADHTAVDQFDEIPSNWIDAVKTMMVAFPGESHSAAYRTGMELLEAVDGTYACNVSKGEAYTDEYVRVDDLGWIGEDTWFTNGAGQAMLNRIWDYDEEGHPFNVLGFGWCSDMTGGDNGSETIDPVYGVHWYGRSSGGPEGKLPWGLDAEDQSITGNSVSLETYLNAMEEYITYCAANSPITQMVFSTGPVNTSSYWNGERGYQGHLKHEAIRKYVKEDETRVLFDYADILCHEDDGSVTTQIWDGHSFPSITPTNETPEEIGHISNAGAIRLAKAQWWMLARIAGWNAPETNGIANGSNITSDVKSKQKLDVYPIPGQESYYLDTGGLDISYIEVLDLIFFELSLI